MVGLVVPKKRKLVKEIRGLAKSYGSVAEIKRQGKHEIWECTGYRFPVPRHSEIAEGTAKAILEGLKNHLESGQK